MRSCLLLPAILVTTALTACDNEDAATHRESVAALERVTALLHDAPANGEQAIVELKMISKKLSGLRGLSRELKASQYRMLTQADLQLAAHLRQRGLADQTKAIEATATIEALSGAATLQRQRLGKRAATSGQLGGDELAAARSATIRLRDGLERQHQSRQPDVAKADEANKIAAAKVLNLRTRAAELLAHAADVDAVTGHPLRVEAAVLDRQAAAMEADMERRSAHTDMYPRLDLDNLSVQTQGVSERVDTLDEEIGRVDALATSRQDLDQAGKTAVDALGVRISAASTNLADVLTGPLKADYDATLAVLQQAVQSANKVNGDRGSNQADQLAKIQAQMALLNLAAARADMLSHVTRVLDAVAAHGQWSGANSWGNTRQELQQDWKSADAIATTARAEAESLIGSLGGPAAAMLLGQLDNRGAPPAAPPEATPIATPDTPAQPGDDAE